jgi:hypothetical protein
MFNDLLEGNGFGKADSATTKSAEESEVGN